MKYHIICKTGEKDKYSVKDANKKNSSVLSFFTDKTSRTIGFNTFDLFSSKGLILDDNIIDLLITSISVFSADRIVKRSTGYENWSRYFVVHLPVHDIKTWSAIKDKIQNMLSFLSGDHWEIRLRKRNKIKINKSKKKQSEEAKKVCLFSGGLDSFIGAVDLLEKYQKEKIVLVSKYCKGPSESKPQKKLFEILKERYSEKRLMHLPFFISVSGGSELTSRARSILFLTHGIAVAHALGKDVPLYFPENGLISLNIPLTSSRRGSLSTRTTHPYFISLFKEVIKALGIDNPIWNPYQFLTKGEMIINSQAPRFIEESAKYTMSCSHPTSRRWHGVSYSHCGYCVPCIIRRAAMNKAKIDVSSDYTFNILKNNLSPKKKGQDLRVFQMAIERGKRSKVPTILQILESGPLPCAIEDKKKHADVYKRGINEVDKFLNKKK